MSRRVTLVLGMHRSGTSALTAALNALGAELGAALVPPADDNPAGYFENARAVAINDALLLALGSGWDDPSPLPVGWTMDPAAGIARVAIGELLEQEFGSAPWSVIKDPRLCRVLPVWLDALRDAGRTVDVILALRSPKAIVASLVKRDRLWAEDAYRLVLAHLLEAEQASRGCRRACLDYDAWMASPEAGLGRIAAAFAWSLPGSDALSLAVARLDPGLRHHVGSQLPLPPGEIPAFAEAVTEALAASPGELEPGLAASAWRAYATPPADAPRLEGLRTALQRERQRLLAASRAFAATDAALAACERASGERLHELEALGRQLADTEAALVCAEALSYAHLADHQAAASERDSLARALEDERGESFRIREALAQTEARATASEARAAALLDELDRIHASRSWRWTAVLRRASAMFRRLKR